MPNTRTCEVPYFLRKTSRFAIDVNIFPRQKHHFVGIIDLVKLKPQLTFFQVKSFLTYNAQHFYENHKSIRIIENYWKWFCSVVDNMSHDYKNVFNISKLSKRTSNLIKTRKYYNKLILFHDKRIYKHLYY